MTLHLKKLESPSPKNALWQVWLELDMWFCRRFLKFSTLYFRYFVIIFRWNRYGSSSKDALYQIWLKLHGSVVLLKYVNVSPLICCYLPLEKGMVLHFNKLESPPSKVCFVLNLIGTSPVGLVNLCQV